MRYRTFVRSANTFEEFSTAKKRTVERGLTLEEARESCKLYNESRTAAQIAKGTKLEFEVES